jgi:hypothetical protein
MALYLEDEYEKLVVEAHFDYKQPNNPINSHPSFQCKFYKVWMKDVATLALGSRLMQGLAKVQAKNEAQESHFMLLGV